MRREAVVFVHQGIRLTYAEFFAKVDEVAAGLYALGVQRGDRVGIWATDNLRVAAAADRDGAGRGDPRQHQSRVPHARARARAQGRAHPDARPDAVVPVLAVRRDGARARARERRSARPTRSGARSSRTCATSSSTTPRAPWPPGGPRPGFYALEGAPADGRRRDRRRELDARRDGLDPDDPINIQFTSGTTGLPQAGAAHASQHPEQRPGRRAAARLHPVGPALRAACPSTTASAWWSPTSAASRAAPAIVVPEEHFDAKAVARRRSTAERCTALHGVPTMFVAELEVPGFREVRPVARCEPASWPAPRARPSSCSGSWARWAAARSSSATARPRPRSVDAHDAQGRLLRGARLHGRHDVGCTRSRRSWTRRPATSLPVGEDGEICFRGYNVMRGYYGMPEDATRERSTTRGWLHSGDIGVMDEDGYVRITGRLKEMIIRGGENIYPAEIEAYLLRAPQGLARSPCSACPTRSRRGDLRLDQAQGGRERRRPRSSRPTSSRASRHFKVPRYVRIVDEFPMTVTGKMQKFQHDASSWPRNWQAQATDA